METPHLLEQQIREILSSIERPGSIHADVDTRTLLYDLASRADWNPDDFAGVAFLSKRVEISNRLYPGYHENGRRASDTEMTDPVWLELAVAVLLKAAIMIEDDLPAALSLKRFNALFKAMDIFAPAWLSAETDLGNALESTWCSLLDSLPETERPEITHRRDPTAASSSIQVLDVIPLTVLFYEGPIARAYLETIRSLGLQPQKIIELVAARDVATKKPVGKWLPKGMRKSFAATIQRDRIHYWPKHLLRTQAGLVGSILAEVHAKLGFDKTGTGNANKHLSLSNYSGCVESLLVEGLGDKMLLQYLANEPEGALLFTGGGIVPSALLNIQHLKFLHIHPGYLPSIRGADCALWSSLLTGHTSASCFYMSPGIDQGDIVLPCWLPGLSFDVDALDIDLKSIYRAIYSFLDPWIRAFVLREIIVSNTQFDALECVPQSEEDGVTFHFMHERLRQAAFSRLLQFQYERELDEQKP